MHTCLADLLPSDPLELRGKRRHPRPSHRTQSARKAAAVGAGRPRRAVVHALHRALARQQDRGHLRRRTDAPALVGAGRRQH